MMKRFKEPSTWAAIGVLFQIARTLAPPQYHALVDSISGLAAVYAGVTPEGVQQ